MLYEDQRNLLTSKMFGMSQCTLPISPVVGKFLGSRDRLVVAGNGPLSSVGIQCIEQDSDTGETSFKNICEYSSHGICTGMEICGVSRLAKSFIALANTEYCGNGNSSIALLEVESGISEARMKHTHSLESASCSSFTSLSFYNEQELLAGSTDSGCVILWDLHTGNEIRRFSADSTGLNKLEFTRSGQLLTCGMSTSAQLHIWDIRTNLSSSSISSTAPVVDSAPRLYASAARCYRHPDNKQIGFGTQQQRPSHVFYTSISSQSMYNKIACGTCRGSVAIWDLRVEAVMEFFPHPPNCSVTAVFANPRRPDQLISASSSGHVRASDLSSSLSSGIQRSYTERSDALISDAGVITSLDCDRDSGMLMAVSSLGGLWRLQLNQ